MKKKIIFVVNVDWFFLSHRLPIAIEAIKHGYEVHVATNITNRMEELLSYGFKIHPVEIIRSSVNLLNETRSFLEILKIFYKIRPNIVHLVTIKPIIYGGIAARLVNLPAIVLSISGLGFVFSTKGWKANLVRCAIIFLYRLIIGKKKLKVIFQNSHDRDTLLRLTKFNPDKAIIIRGSGVDLNIFLRTPLPQGIPIVMMASRLLYDKGVVEFVEAARLLKNRGIQSSFWLVGSNDIENPASIKTDDLLAWRNEGAVELKGYCNDMVDMISKAYLVVLPSYHEGLPRVLIEAAASGRPVVTTDHPGCRDAIVPDRTGLIVPSRNSKVLADAIQRLLENPKLCEKMAVAGRQLAESEFAIEKVVAIHMALYRDLLDSV